MGVSNAVRVGIELAVAIGDTVIDVAAVALGVTVEAPTEGPPCATVGSGSKASEDDGRGSREGLGGRGFGNDPPDCIGPTGDPLIIGVETTDDDGGRLIELGDAESEGLALMDCDGVGVIDAEGVTEADCDGLDVGLSDGLDVGVGDGLEVGVSEGLEVAVNDGLDVGVNEGLEVGVDEGLELGVNEGLELGVNDGLEVGVCEAFDISDGVGVEVGDAVAAAEGGDDAVGFDGITLLEAGAWDAIGTITAPLGITLFTGEVGNPGELPSADGAREGNSLSPELGSPGALGDSPPGPVAGG